MMLFYDFCHPSGLSWKRTNSFYAEIFDSAEICPLRKLGLVQIIFAFDSNGFNLYFSR